MLDKAASSIKLHGRKFDNFLTRFLETLLEGIDEITFNRLEYNQLKKQNILINIESLINEFKRFDFLNHVWKQCCSSFNHG